MDTKRVYFLLYGIILSWLYMPASFAQQAVVIDDNIKQHIFSYKEIEVLVDTQSIYTIKEVSSESFSGRFEASRTFIPKTFNNKNTYWYRIRLNDSLQTRENWVIEFYDQTIDHITVYIPDSLNRYMKFNYGASLPFDRRVYHHKNVTFNIDKNFTGDKVYYFSIKTEQPAAVMVVLKKVSWFIQYGLKEYLFLGILYGMIAVFCLYNFVMFLAVRRTQYIYYIVYNLSIGAYEMSSNGIAYQFLWPNSPNWNEIAYGFALYLAAIFGLLFTRSFLHLKQKAPLLDKAIITVMVLRTIFFLICFFINNHWFVYKIIEVVPVLLALYAGIYVLFKGYHPARFFVTGYSFILLGFIIRVIKILNVANLPFGPANFYSLSFCLVMEMLFVSFAIGDNIRLLKKKKEKAQKRIIRELQLKQDLKDNINKQLEQKVKIRTREVVEKSGIIEKQNEVLIEQSQEISRMNALLTQDNQALQINIEEVNQARVLSKELSFEEFSKIYPDNNTCFKFLADLKWEKGFSCKKCNTSLFSNGHLAYSRRCSKCDYDESVIVNTVFQNSRIPINKAFFMVYMIYTTKGRISSYKLSEILDLRQATCWSYSSKIKKVMDERKKELRNAGEKGWSKLVLE